MGQTHPVNPSQQSDWLPALLFMDLCFITAPSLFSADYNSQKPLIKPYAVKALFSIIICL